MKKLLYPIYITLFALFIASCTDDDKVGVEPGENNNIVINGGINSRAVNTEWEAGDEIGVTVYNPDYTQILDNDFNKCYRTQETLGMFTAISDANLAYFPQNGSQIRLATYYPYWSGLSTDMLYPVNVANQNDLPAIDLMTGVHRSGFSKTDPDVDIFFYHRLSKLIFNLATEEGGDYVSLADCQLTLKGMYNNRTYDLINTTFADNGSNPGDIEVPRRTGEVTSYREAIVLPRTARAGVVFEFATPDGDTYIANMADTLELKSGYQYIFNVTLSQNPITVSATIEPWMDTDPIYYDIVIVQPPANENINVTPGDELNIYLQDEAGTDFSFLKTYTYTANDTWSTDPPLYWEDIEQDPAILRASIIAAQPLNTTQLPDILLAEQISVARYNPANFVLSHALSKVMVRLQSDTFSDSDLNSATITLPDYLTGGYEENGAFVEGTTRGDILVDRTDPQNSVAIFQPQIIDPANPLLTVTINGRPYNVTEVNGFTYAPGVAYAFIVTVHKEEVSLSVTVIDWTEQKITLNAITIGTSVSGGTGVLNGEQLIVYTGDDTTRQELTTFTYNATTDSLIANPVVYWEALEDPTTFYGYIERAPYYNNTQLPDWLVATPETVNASNGVHLELSHATAQIAVRLTSEDGTFSTAELQGMGITLPGYLTGATMNNGVFQPGTTTGNITVERGVGSNENSGLALIQPQTIDAGNSVLQVTFNGRPYTATYNSDITYPAGVTTILTVDMSKTAVSISASVTDWDDGERIALVPIAINVTGKLLDTEAFFEDKTIYINKLTNNAVEETYPYTYTEGTNGYEWNGTPIYWDDQPNLSLDMTAIYSTTGQPALTGTTFIWNIAADQSNAGNSYYDHYDLLVSRADLSSPQNVNFEFTHATSKVVLKLVAGTGFEESELVGSTVVLNNFLLSGTMDLTTGILINPTNFATVITPKTETDGEEYSALVMPQTRTGSSVIATITLPGYPDTPFQAITGSNLSFVAGKQTIITVTLNKTAIELSAQLAAWGPGDNGGITIE